MLESTIALEIDNEDAQVLLAGLRSMQEGGIEDLPNFESSYDKMEELIDKLELLANPMLANLKKSIENSGK